MLHSRTMQKLFGCLIAGGLLNGCASFLPYEDDFACKNEDHGQCIHPEAAYREAVNQTAPDAGFREVNHAPRKKSRDPKQEQGELVAVGYDGYQEAVYSQLQTMIERPVTPMVAPAKTVRTLILPYTDDQSAGRLYMPRYVFSVLQGPKFVLGDYLMSGERDLAGTLASGLFTSPANTLGSPSDLTPASMTATGEKKSHGKNGN